MCAYRPSCPLHCYNIFNRKCNYFDTLREATMADKHLTTEALLSALCCHSAKGSFSDSWLNWLLFSIFSVCVWTPDGGIMTLMSNTGSLLLCSFPPFHLLPFSPSLNFISINTRSASPQPLLRTIIFLSVHILLSSVSFRFPSTLILLSCLFSVLPLPSQSLQPVKSLFNLYFFYRLSIVYSLITHPPLTSL